VNDFGQNPRRRHFGELSQRSFLPEVIRASGFPKIADFDLAFLKTKSRRGLVNMKKAKVHFCFARGRIFCAVATNLTEIGVVLAGIFISSIDIWAR
jgi:hypothetical protein